MLAFALAAFVLVLPRAIQAQTLAAGASHTCVVLPGGAVKCWGGNRYGQLGLGDTNARGDQPGEMGAALPFVSLPEGATALAAGAYHTCALLSGGTVACWGSNTDGQLGLGDTNARGDQSGEMGASLPTVALGSAATALVAGAYHTCALLATGAVKCWGGNRYGQLGLGDTNARGDQPGEMGAALPVVALAGAATELVSGSDHTCALLATGAVQCWGYGGYGQLGYGTTTARGDQSGEMGTNLPQLTFPGGADLLVAGADHTCARAATGGGVRCWGRSDRGQTGSGDRVAVLAPAAVALPLAVQALSAGGDRTCAVFSDASLRCWGGNTFGELGLGTTADRGAQAGEMGAALATTEIVAEAVTVALGASHACVVLSSNMMQCWGSGSSGRLGTGGTATLGDQPGEMGAALPFVDFGVPLPVELVGLRVLRDGRRVRVLWETASETNNAGFTVEHGNGPEWAALVDVPGHGTTTERHAYAVTTDVLAPGRHRFRLVQRDLDGRTSVSGVVELALGLDGSAAYALTPAGPEPFAARTRYTLVVAAPQHVRATLHDALGRTVAVLADTPAAADTPLLLDIDGAALSPGVYLLRVVGERFAATQAVTRAR